MKEGKFHIGFLVTIILSIVIILMVTTFYGQVFSGTDEDISNLQSCVGLIGSLGMGEGYCYPDNRCSKKADVDNTVANWAGSRWQPIGLGWGCDEPGYPYCCIQTTFYDKDIDVEGTLETKFCNEETELGSMRIIKNIDDKPACLPLDMVLSTLSSEEPFGFQYYAKTNRQNGCIISMSLKGETIDIPFGVQTITCQQKGSGFSMGGVTLLQIMQQLFDGGTPLVPDVAMLNEVTELEVRITEDGETITASVKVDISTPVCSSRRGDEDCYGKLGGVPVRVQKTVNLEPVVAEISCDMGDNYACVIGSDPVFITGYARCEEVTVDGTVDDSAICKGLVMPYFQGNICWVHNYGPTFTCKFLTEGKCEQVFHDLEGSFDWLYQIGIGSSTSARTRATFPECSS